jgi:hypothetical protein
LDLNRIASVEVSSEDPAHPIEGALLQESSRGWRALEPGIQTIRLIFDKPQSVQKVELVFDEAAVERTQEFVLRWSALSDGGFRDILRQQWNFSPAGSTQETENLAVQLSGATALELAINPDISGGSARASLSSLRLA